MIIGRPAPLSLLVLSLVAAATAQLAKNRFREFRVCSRALRGRKQLVVSCWIGMPVRRRQRVCCRSCGCSRAPMASEQDRCLLQRRRAGLCCLPPARSRAAQLLTALQRRSCWRKSGPSQTGRALHPPTASRAGRTSTRVQAPPMCASGRASAAPSMTSLSSRCEQRLGQGPWQRG